MICVSLTIDNALNEDSTERRIPGSHLFQSLWISTKVRGQESGTETPRLHAITLKGVLPSQHQHVQRGLAGAVADRHAKSLLRPAGRHLLGKGGGEEVCLGSLEARKTRGHEEKAWHLRGLQQERCKGVRQDVCARDIQVKSPVQRLPEGACRTATSEPVVELRTYMIVSVVSCGTLLGVQGDVLDGPYQRC